MTEDKISNRESTHTELLEIVEGLHKSRHAIANCEALSDEERHDINRPLLAAQIWLKGFVRAIFESEETNDVGKNTENIPPYIVSAATTFIVDGEEVVIVSPRHWDDIMRNIVKLLPESAKEKEQGFVDQYRKFYTRKEAWVIAEQNGQIKRRVGGDNQKLFSENLY